jgi:hypothetical protein
MAQSQKQNHANQGQDGTAELEGKQSNPTNSPNFDDKQRMRQLQENAQTRPERQHEMADRISGNSGKDG